MLLSMVLTDENAQIPMYKVQLPENITDLLNSTQLYYDTFAAEQLDSWIAKYSSIT